MVRVVLSALVYAGKNQSPCLHETLAAAAVTTRDLRSVFLMVYCMTPLPLKEYVTPSMTMEVLETMAPPAAGSI